MKNIFYIFCLGILLACSNNKAESDKTTTVQKNNDEVAIEPTQLQNMNLTIGQAQESSSSNEIKVSGMADVPPENMASVSFPINGFIKNISHNVLPGRYVQKGGILASVQSMEFIQLQQDYWQAVYQGSFMEKELNRQRILMNEDATAQKKLQQIESEYNANQSLQKSILAKFVLLNFDINKLQNKEVKATLNIYSPISGYIKTANVSIGKNIAPSDLLFEIISKEHIHFELKVYEKDAYLIHEGQSVIMNDPRLGGKVSGKIFLIGKTFEGESKTVNIHVHLDNEAIEAKILPGMYINATILAGTKPATVLPESAILMQNNENFIFVRQSTSPKEIIFKKYAVTITNTEAGKVAINMPKELTLQSDIVLKGCNTINAMLEKAED